MMETPHWSLGLLPPFPSLGQPWRVSSHATLDIESHHLKKPPMALFKLMERQRHVLCDTSDPSQNRIRGEFLSFDGTGSEAGSSAASSCYLCSPGTKQRTSGFLSNTYLDCKPYTSLHNKYSLTKHSSRDAVSSQNPETPCPCHLHPTHRYPLGPGNISFVQRVRQRLLQASHSDRFDKSD